MSPTAFFSPLRVFRPRGAARPVLAAIAFVLLVAPATEADDPVAPEVTDVPEVLVFGSMEESLAWLESEDWWGGHFDDNPRAPRVLVTGVSDRWQQDAQTMTVAQKKEAFYRMMLPLLLHANELVRNRRAELERARETLSGGGALDADTLGRLREGAVRLRAASEDQVAGLGADDAAWLPIIDDLLYRVDEVPPGLALGQAAYESGYATSRFAREGNSFFGQWTYGGDGIKPEQQRQSLGDHRIAAFEWPFDSVRGYFRNLMSHPAYEDLRRLRAEQRAEGEPLDSMVLADGLIRYSERGQEYVDTLKGIIRVNQLTAADNAVLRDEPLRFYLAAETPEDAEVIRGEIARMRESGELEEIFERMNLF